MSYKTPVDFAGLMRSPSACPEQYQSDPRFCCKEIL
jgi:hypothetical protein